MILKDLKCENIIEYAPILIPTMNRINHLKRCILSLQNNTHAEKTDLVISIDYPPQDKYREDYKKVCQYLENGIKGFNSVKIIKQTENLGAYKNYLFLKEYAKQKYSRFIFSEDDNEYAPNFLDYVNKGLHIFEDNKKIIAICSNGIAKISNYEGNVALTQNFSAQGYGTWSKKDDELTLAITREYFEKIARNKELLKNMYLQDVSVFYSFKSAILADQKLYQLQDKQVPIVDMTIKVYMMEKQLYTIAPIIQTSRNYGYDGSGVNCPKVKQAGEEPVIDVNKEFNYLVSESLPIHKFEQKIGLKDYIRILGCKMKLLHYLMNIK